ncbi:MAG: MFS transporter [Actinomycetota bacterium]
MATTTDDRILTRETFPFLVGGFLGPFGTMVVISIYPELRESFDASNSAVTWSFSGYMFAMALLMLISGTIGERYGRRRVTRTTFIVYAAASLIGAIAPTLGVFLGARIVMGIANAFITPLLLAGLSEIVDERRLGRAVGVYASFQAAGAAVAPFASGVIAEVDWRWTFVLVGVVSIALALRPAPGEPRPAAEAPPIRPLLRGPMIRLWAAGFAAAAGPIGLAVLVGVRLRDQLDVTSSTAGVILLASGLVTMVTSPFWGSSIDRLGGRQASLVAVGSTVVIGASLGLFDGAGSFTTVWLVTSATYGFIALNLQRLAAVAVPDNRGGALSSVLAFRFLGHAAGPLVFVPMLEWSAPVAFATASALGVVTLAVYLTAEQPTPAPG